MALALPTAAFAADEIVGKVRVIDGDTFDVGPVRVRLFGIDAPEQDQPCQTEQGASFACGAWVTGEVAERYQGRTVRCQQVDTDRYGRAVARCALQGEDVGRRLVEEGLAYAFRRYSMDYDLEEKQAFVAQRGLHGMILQTPAQHRSSPPRARLPVSAECRIKGNISGNGRIYHMPGQQHYGKVVISPAKGERLFCTEEEARAAGWRRARR
ncbi:MAG: thermonuclease family protein [Sulfitobacter sp.]|nr:thermonuclease family protein [Sulfitobacter sp.]